MKIGIAGTGRMGTAIALRLLELDNEVTVWNRTFRKTAVATAAGAAIARTPADLASRCDSIITILTNAEALDQVYTGEDALLSGNVRDKLFIEMSTVRADDHRALAPKVAAMEATLLECPVSGTVTPAREGKLFGFAGGAPSAFSDAQPLLAQLCRRVELIGPLGSGANMKLAANLLLTVFWQALAEACSLMRPVAIQPQRLIELLADSNIGAGILKVRGELVASGLQGKGTETATFDVDFMRKDLRDMLSEAAALEVTLPVAAATLKHFDAASFAGFGEIDATQYPAWWIDHSKTEQD